MFIISYFYEKFPSVAYVVYTITLIIQYTIAKHSALLCDDDDDVP